MVAGSSNFVSVVICTVVVEVMHLRRGEWMFRRSDDIKINNCNFRVKKEKEDIHVTILTLNSSLSLANR